MKLELSIKIYIGENRHTYALYSVATDEVNHEETEPAGADTTTRIELGGPAPPPPGCAICGPGAPATAELTLCLFAFVSWCCRGKR